MRIKLGLPLKLSEIARATDGILNVKDAIISHISTDTRELFEKDLFVAINGADGFAKMAKDLGAFTLSKGDDADIQIPIETDSLLKIASYYIKKLPYLLYRVAITGSVGKTTTKEFTKIILSERYRTHANAGNYNNSIGLPLSVLQAPTDTQILIMEMGMNHFGEIARLSECFQPDIAIITNIGTSHIGNFGSRENIAKAKLEISTGINTGNIFVPHEEVLLKNVEGRISVSILSRDADYTLLNENNNVSLYSRKEYIFTSEFRFPEQHHIIDLAYACSLASFLGLDAKEIADGISKILDDNIRQKVVFGNNFCFYVDCYNSSLESIEALYNTAKRYRDGSPKSLLLGDILELGNHSKDIHRAAGRKISKDVFKSVFLFGEYAEYVKEGLIVSDFPANRIFINHDFSLPEITAEQIKGNCSSGEIIFMKASRAVKLERILDYFV